MGAKAIAPALVLTLAGCAAPPVAEPGMPWTLGRLALRVDASGTRPVQSLNLGFELRGDGERGELRLTGPLGARVAEARWRPGEALLDSGQGPVRHASLDALALQALGEPMPLQALPQWLAGRPWDGAPYRTLPPPAVGFEQLGWHIDLSRRAEGHVLAQREAPPPRVLLRVRLESTD